MPNAYVDLTAVCTIVGVVFAIAIAYFSSIKGNKILGRHSFETRKYELYFEQKCNAFLSFIEVSTRLLIDQQLDAAGTKEFEYICYRAKLFASPETAEHVAMLESKIAILSNSQAKNIAPIMQLLDKTVQLMQKELSNCECNDT